MKIKPVPILLIEAAACTSQLIEQALTGLTFDTKISHVSAGPAALDLLADPQFDIVIISHHPPELDGLALLQQMSRDNKTSAVIFMAEAGAEAAIKTALELGVHSYLIKDAAEGYLTLLPSLIRSTHQAYQQFEETRQRADQAAIAIENTRLYQEQHTHRREAQALHRAALALVSTVKLDEVIELILIELQKVVPYDSASVQLLRGDQLEIIGGRGFPDLSSLIGFNFDLNQAKNRLNKTVLETRQPLIIDDTSAFLDCFQIEPHNIVETQSWLAVPMLLGQQPLGLITLDKLEINFYQEKHTHLAKAFATQAAIAIQNAQLYEQAQQEIMERKRAEAALNEYQAQLEELVRERTAKLEQAMIEAAEAKDKINAILQSVADGLIVTDVNHQMVLANPAAENLLDFSPEIMLNQSPGEAVPNNWLKQLVYSTLSHRVQVSEIDVKLKSLDGKQTKILHARTALVDDYRGNLLGTVTIIQDVTRLREVDRLKTEFLSNAAHQLRTPLTTVLGFSEILLNRQLDQHRQERYLTLINEQATQLAEIVNNLLDISRLEAGKSLDLNIQPLDMERLLRDTAKLFIEATSKHHFQFEGLTNLPLVKGDKLRLEQVSKNLLSNAVKYSPDGGNIIIRSLVKSDHIEFMVQDEGIGITPEEQIHLFEKFYRADTSHTAIGGTGLGLAISKLIINLHNGSMWVESQPDIGTTAHFTLPLADNPSLEPHA
jgi:PAS domain S-box-containing protein